MATTKPQSVVPGVLATTFWRKTIDTIAIVYTILIVALIVGQQITPLEFKVFSYTSVSRDGAAHDYCNPQPLYSIDPGVIVQLYNTMFPGAVLPLSSEQQVQEMILESAGIYGAEYPFNLFSVPDRHFCIGPQHYAAAFDLKYHRSASVFWTYVFDHTDEIYNPSLDREGWIASLLSTYAIPVWAYMVCRFIYEILMMIQLWKHDTPSPDDKERMRIENVAWFNIFSSVLPFLLSSAAFIMLIMKLMGMWLTDSAGICAIAILFGVAAVCKWIPVCIMRIMLYRNTKKGPTSIADSLLNLQPAPYEWVPMVAFYAMTLIVTIIIASLYISNDLTGLTFRVFDKQCTEYNGRASTYDSCVDSTGVAYKSTTSHLFLAYLSPVLLLVVWRMIYFVYYIHKWGKLSLQAGKDSQPIDAQIQAGVAFLAHWRIRAKTVSANTTAPVNGFEICYRTPVDQPGKTSAEIKTHTQLLLIGRFLIPSVICVVGILLGLLKLSQYALWNGCPWWVIGVLFGASIMVAILAEIIPLLCYPLPKPGTTKTVPGNILTYETSRVI